MDDPVSQQYAQAVLSYAPHSHWHRVIDHVESSSSSSTVLPVHKLLAVDAYFSLFDAKKARALLTASPLSILENATDEVKSLHRALHAWVIDGALDTAYDHFLAGLHANPRNLFLCKRAQLMALIAGENMKIVEPVKLVEVEKVNKGQPYFAGMLVFGYEQSEDFGMAEKIAREAIDRGESDGWLDHGYVHSLYFQGKGRMKDATDYLHERQHTWSTEKIMPFLYTHLWWHYALVLTEGRQIEKALNVFDSRLWPQDRPELKTDMQVQLNAMELLWKMESLELHEQTLPRWRDVLKFVRPHLSENRDPLHTVLALRACAVLKDSKGIESILSALNTPAHEDLKAICTAVVQVCTGKTEHLSKGREQLRRLQDKWHVLGNSTEQRAILLELAYDAPVVCGTPAQSAA